MLFRSSVEPIENQYRKSQAIKFILKITSVGFVVAGFVPTIITMF